MTHSRKSTARKSTVPKPAPPSPGGFIDAALMERAIALRGEGLTMKAIGAELGVKATGYLAKRIKETYGADALDRPSAQSAPQPEPAKAQSATAKRPRASRKPATAKGA